MFIRNTFFSIKNKILSSIRQTSTAAGTSESSSGLNNFNRLVEKLRNDPSPQAKKSFEETQAKFQEELRKGNIEDRTVDPDLISNALDEAAENHKRSFYG
jgi:ATP-dependent protease HslVU (ClpYQ) ATPase subunit